MIHLKFVFFRKSIILFIILISSSFTIAKEAFDEDLIFIPQPRNIKYLKGQFKAQETEFIWADVKKSEKLFNISLIIKDSLKKTGFDLQITAAEGNSPELIAVSLKLDQEKIPHSEGYILEIAEKKIDITAHDPAGVFYAAQTLKQICRQYENKELLPCLKIKDWPDFENRGVMLDISRDRVPQMNTLYKLVDRLSEWKINQLQLYTEHTFAYRDHKVVWQGASPMTPEQILKLDAYCKERYIDLVPNQNSLGHLNDWLEHEEYEHLAECLESVKSKRFGVVSRYSLSPAEPGSIKLIEELYSELLPHFSTDRINVGCDEMKTLCYCKTKPLCEEKGKKNVYLNFLREIHQLAKSHCYRIQFWSDFVTREHPELLNQLPEGVVALIWGYEPDHNFEKECKLTRVADIDFYVCPGTRTWQSLGGKTDFAIGNIKNAAETGLAYGAKGLLNTDWGDGPWGDITHHSFSYLGYAYGAAASWSVEANKNIDIAKALSVHRFFDKNHKAGKIFYDLGNAYKILKADKFNSNMFWYSMINNHLSYDHWLMKKLKIENLQHSKKYINRVISTLPETDMSCWDAALVKKEIENAGELLKHSCDLNIARLKTYDGKIKNISSEKRAELADDMAEIIEEFKNIWLKRERKGGLKHTLLELQELLNLYRQ